MGRETPIAEAREDGKQKEHKKERGSKDDWEALKIVLDELPALKQRVLHRMRALIKKNEEADKKISKKATQAYLREMKKSRKEKK